MVLQPVADVLEPDSGENTTVTGCFSAEISPRLERDAIFNFFTLFSSTALEFVDYVVEGGNFFNGSSLIIPSDFFGSFFTCISLVILGDDEVESVEEAIFALDASSPCDRVSFPDDLPNTGALVIRIFDNDGKLETKELMYRTKMSDVWP